MIMYFFPSPFKAEKIKLNKADIKSSPFLLDSGKSALRIALRSLKLPPDAKVGIPSFCCNAVEDAVRKENLFPYFFDSKDEDTFWANYSEEKIIREQIKTIIITHLYGFKHPDTDRILEFCHKNKINVIHDLAQSYGLNTSGFGKDILIYSFGAGKSTTAALGGEIVNLNITHKASISSSNARQKIDAILFYYSRLYGFKFKFLIVFLNKILYKLLKQTEDIREMSKFQEKKAAEAKFLVMNKSDERKERYNYLTDSIANNNKIKLAYNVSSGLYFKFVMYLPDDVDGFISYLNSNKVPYYRLGPDIVLENRDIDKLPNFYKSYKNFVEISTERSIDIEEIKRVGEVLKNYR